MSIFIFRVIWGGSCNPLRTPFCDSSVIVNAKMGDSFQVHVFGDPGMEMMPECSGCMCYKHNKDDVVCMISLVHLFMNLVS